MIERFGKEDIPQRPLQQQDTESLRARLQQIEAEMTRLAGEAGALRAQIASAEGFLEHVPAEESQIEFAKDGKLVNDGAESWVVSDFDLTSLSKGLSPRFVSTITAAEKFFGVRLDSLSNIRKEAWPTGALVMRSYPEGVVAERFRYRSESGESRPGRQYRQMTIEVIPTEIWNRSASAFAEHLASLKADPDSQKTPLNERRDVEPRTVALGAHDVLRYEGLDKGAKLIADALIGMTESGYTVPKSIFENEQEFLAAVGRAVETLSRTAPDKVHDIRIASGLVNIRGPWIRY